MNCQFSIFELLCHYHSIPKIYNFYGGELTVHKQYETLGDIIKIAREESNITVELLANKVGISERYLYRIENEGKTPSYNVLYKLIRSLGISPNSIFYPEAKVNLHKIDRITNLLCKCDDNTLSIVEVIVKAMLT